MRELTLQKAKVEGHIYGSGDGVRMRIYDLAFSTKQPELTHQDQETEEIGIVL